MMLKHGPKIGEAVLRIDGRDKVDGTQVYPSDFVLDGMLSLKIHRAPHPHAKILSLDTTKAEAFPGVVRVITAADIPGNKMTGLMQSDMPLLCDEIVRRQADPLAIIAAETEVAARSAAALIEVEYELLPVISDVRAALQPGSPRVHPAGNLVAELHFNQGDIEKAFARADLVFEYEYQTGRQEHAFLETEGGTAYYDEEGRLTVRFGGQHPHWDRQIIAGVLGLSEDKLRVISPFVGGSFGGKDDIDVQCYLALATHLTGRPSRIQYDRQESILSGNKRHPFTVVIKSACSREGEWIAADVKLYADTGAYAGWGVEVLKTAVNNCLGPYRIPHTRVDAFCVYTNNSNASAFRGFGGLQATFPLEQQVDEMARACGMDPIEFRKKNTLEPGETAGLGFILEDRLSFKDVLSAAQEGPIYSQRDQLVSLPERESSSKKRGIGIAASWMGVGYGRGVPDSAEVHIRLKDDGHYQFLLGGTDMGQGNATALMQIAAHELNAGMEAFELVLGDSLGPDAGSCDAARQMSLVGSAALDAALDLREKIINEAARELDADPQNLKLVGGTIVNKHSGEARPLEGLGEITGRGVWTTPEDQAMAPGIPAFLYTTGAQVVLVEVDLQTGKVDVLKMHNVIDTGKTINQQGVEGQSDGGLVQGLGYALFEDCVVQDGEIMNTDFSTYLIPTIADVPEEIVTTCLEVPGKIGPYGAKGIAEMVLVPTAPAILNAVYDAIGERFTKIPLTAEDVYRRLSKAN